jgi:hypothetical protein
MEPVSEALRLLQRQVELEAAQPAPGPVPVPEQPELYSLKARLSQYPQAARAVLEASRSLKRPLAQLTAREVEGWLGTGIR